LGPPQCNQLNQLGAWSNPPNLIGPLWPSRRFVEHSIRAATDPWHAWRSLGEQPENLFTWPTRSQPTSVWGSSHEPRGENTGNNAALRLDPDGWLVRIDSSMRQPCIDSSEAFFALGNSSTMLQAH